MRIIFISIFLLLSLALLSQNIIKNPITVARYYDNDTIVISSSIAINSVKLSMPIFSSNSLTYMENGKKEMMHTRRVKFMEFIDFEKKNRRFVSPRLINEHLVDDQKINYKVNYLFEEMYSGKMKWYRRYTADIYDHSEHRLDYFILDGHWYYRNQFVNLKNFFKKMLQKYPEIAQIAEKRKFNYNRVERDLQILFLLKEIDSQLVE